MVQESITRYAKLNVQEMRQSEQTIEDLSGIEVLFPLAHAHNAHPVTQSIDGTVVDSIVATLDLWGLGDAAAQQKAQVYRGNV